MSSIWNPLSWTAHPVQQAPAYPDAAAHAAALAQLRQLPPLVLAPEVRALQAQLARVAAGEAFLLQGGDCAESFSEFHARTVRDTTQTLLQMALLLGQQQPVVSVGRIAGQFAKPRSSPTERIDSIELPSYRGDIVNGAAFDAASRVPDPQRMLQAYRQSALTLNLLRALQQTGFSSAEAIALRHRQFVAELQAHGVAIDAAAMPAGGAQPVYTSHEALLLPYETALTHQDESDRRWYAGSAHMVWIGDRTRQLDGAHVEFCRGIANPLGLKCGPSLDADALLRLLDRLDPQREPGRITLIVRMGAGKLDAALPALIRAVAREGRPVIWSCDPMHGNTISAGRYKTRPFDAVADEMRSFFAIHRAEGSHAGGLHLEMTGKDVTECIGGAQALAEPDLGLRYHTQCDPRLNALQAVQLASLAAEAMRAPVAALAA